MKVTRHGRPRCLSRWVAALAAVALGATALSACAETKAEPDGPAILRFGIATDITGLNPATGRHDRPVRPLAYEPLIQLSTEGEFVPGLAIEWSYFDDNKGFEMKLRPDAKFSDGTPVDAAAVVAWFEYFAATKGPLSPQLSFASAEAVGDAVVRLHLNDPDPEVEVKLAINNWGSVAAAAALDDPTVLDTETFGAGPYVLDSERTVTGDTYVYVPNEYYYDQDVIAWDEIEVKIITNPTSMLQAVQSGQLDAAIGSAGTADAAAASEGIDVVSAPAITEAFIIGDLAGDLVPQTADVRVRQAINLAIDREAVVAALVGDYGTPSSAISPSNARMPELETYYEYDPEKARELLEAAGYADGFTLRLIETPAKTELTQAVASYLSEVGITLEVVTASTGADFVREIGTKTFALVAQELPTEAPAWFFYTASMRPGAFFNFTGWDIPELTELTSEAASAAEFDWTAFTELVTEQAVYVPIYKRDTIYYVSPGVEGVVIAQGSGGFPLVTDWHPAD